MVAAAVLHESYPQDWYTADGVVELKRIGSAVGPTLNTMLTKISRSAESSSMEREEADAGAGGKSINSTNSKEQASTSSELDHGAVETVAATLDLNELANELEHKCTHQSYAGKDIAHVPNRHRLSLLRMLSGDGHTVEETTLSSMLIATVLENEAIDDEALEMFGVFPSSANGETCSLFEVAIADYLSRDVSSHHLDPNAPSHSELATSLECISSLGLQYLERVIHHTWTEGGECLDEAPFNLYYHSSRFIKALCSSLTFFAKYAQQILQRDPVLFADFMEEEIRKRYSSNELESRYGHQKEEEKTKLVCSLTNFSPSNLIDRSNLLISESTRSTGSSTGNEIEAARFSIRLTLHFRSLLWCIQEFHERFTSLTGPRSIASKRWCYEDDALSFHTIMDIDDTLLAIGGFKTTQLPRLGTDIDLRGRTFYHGYEFKLKQHWNLSAVVRELAFVCDPTVLYVTNVSVVDLNRHRILAVVPLRCVIASATEGSMLHVAVRYATSSTEQQVEAKDELIKNGKLSLCFETENTSVMVKECLDKYCSAYRKRIAMDIDDMLEECCCADESKINESWSDFQQP